MRYRYYERDSRNLEITPEKALWCSVFVTYFEDMNYYVELKTKLLLSEEQKFDLSNRGLDTTAVVSRDKYLALLELRQRKLLYSAKHPYIKNTFDVLNLDHSSFFKRLLWQYKENSKIKLTALNFDY